MEPLVITPSTGRPVGLIAISAVLTICCALMIGSGGLTSVVGVIGVAFFGGGTVMLLVRRARGAATLTLEPEGLRPGSGGFAPWRDVGGFGATSTSGAASLGVWLTDPANHLASLTPPQRSLMLKTALAVKGAAPILGAADPGYAREVVTLGSVPSHDVGAALQWAKNQSGGYDLTFAALSLDRPIPALVLVCEQFRAAAIAYLGPSQQLPPHPPQQPRWSPPPPGPPSA